MVRRRSAEADEIAPAQLVERPLQMTLVGEPALVFRDHGCAVAIGPDPERIAPFAAVAEINGANWHAGMMLVKNPAHGNRLSIVIAMSSPQDGVGCEGHRSRLATGIGLPVDPRAAASKTSAPQPRIASALAEASCALKAEAAVARVSAALPRTGMQHRFSYPFSSLFPNAVRSSFQSPVRGRDRAYSALASAAMARTRSA